MATSRKTSILCPECGSEDTGNTLHKNTYEFECGTHWIPDQYYAGSGEYLSVSVACRTIEALTLVAVTAVEMVEDPQVVLYANENCHQTDHRRASEKIAAFEDAVKQWQSPLEVDDGV